MVAFFFFFSTDEEREKSILELSDTISILNMISESKVPSELDTSEFNDFSNEEIEKSIKCLEKAIQAIQHSAFKENQK